MEILLLGPLEVRVGDRVPNLGGSKPRALLAVLGLNAGRVMPSERLIELLWGEEAPASAGNALQVHVSALRKLLEPTGAPYRLLVSKAPGYMLDVPPEQIDLHRFEGLADDGRQALQRGDAATASRLLREAMGLWRGTALAGLEQEPWVVAEAHRLEELRVGAEEDRIDAELTLGRHSELVGDLEVLVAEHPLREGISRQLMLALYRSGRQAEASAVYYQARETLVDQLGMEPGPGLQQLLKQILNQDPALDIAPRPAAPRTNLPAQLTKYVGRSREISDVRALLNRSRLVTLVGAGGIGKTRLALEVASQLVDEVKEGVWLVELAALVDSDLVVKAVMSTFGLHDEGGGSDIARLTDFLRGRQTLLLLDNCEHLTGTVEGITSALLRDCPDLRILATSRESLGVVGELAWRVPSMSSPDPKELPALAELPGFDAMALFCEAASRGDASFTLIESEAHDVATICHRLDGIPLAIELATSRLNVFSVHELVERLDDSFALLSGGSRSAVGRHQTLNATIAWSYDLLSPPEQSLFRRLAVFAGSFTLTAAEAVGGADEGEPNVLELLGRLLEKSLVLRETARGASTRFRLLEVLRQFGSARLNESGQASRIRDRHLAYVVAVAEEWSPKVRGRDQAAALNRLEIEHDNIRAALTWSVEAGRGDSALRLVAAMWLFWHIRGHGAEGYRWASQVLARFDQPHPLMGDALLGASHLAGWQRDLERAGSLAAQALAHFEQQCDSSGRGLALVSRANVANLEGRLAEEERDLDDALVLLRESGNEWGVSQALNNLASQAIQLQRYSDAEGYLTESLALARRIADPWRASMALGNLGDLYVKQDMVRQAAEVTLQCLLLQRDGHNAFALPFEIEVCSRLAAARSDQEQALRLSGVAEGMHRRYGEIPTPEEAQEIHRTIEGARRNLSAGIAANVWQQGLEMTTEQAIDLAIDWLKSVLRHHQPAAVHDGRLDAVAGQ